MYTAITLIMNIFPANTHDTAPQAPTGVHTQHTTRRIQKRAGAGLYIETGLFMDHVSYR